MANDTLNSAIRWLALIILLAVAAYIYIASTSEDSTALKEKLSRLSLVELIIPIMLSLLSYFLRFTRWRLILRQFGYTLPIRSDLIFYLSGFALTMTPGKSGETIRSAFLLQARIPFQVSLSAFVIERSLDLLIVGLLATFLFISPLVTLLLFLSVIVMLSFIGSRLPQLEQRSRKIILPSFFSCLLAALTQASVALKLKSLTSYALLGSAAWIAQGAGFYYIARIFTQNIEIVSAISTYCAGLLVGAASLIPGGVGVTEASLSWLLQTQGVDQNSAILSALISRGCTLWLAVAIGCIALTAIIKGYTNHLNPQGS